MLSPLSSLANSIFLFLKTDDFPADLETASSKCLHLDAKNQVFQQVLLSMKLMQKKCKKKTREEEKEVGAISSVPQKSYRNEYDRTQLSRAISTGD